MTANVYIDSFQRIQFYGKPDTNGNITPVANILASATGNLISYIPGENIEFTVDQATGNIHINAPSYSPVVDYWRTFRDFESNASIIADQAQDVVTFKGGDNIRLDFNEGDDIITWHADLSGAAESLQANLSVVNSNVEINPSMLDYDESTGVFTYFPPDLTVYATTQYVDQAVASGVANIDLTGYATEKYVEDYVNNNVIPLIPDMSQYVSYQDFNNWIQLINSEFSAILFANLPTSPTPLNGQRYTLIDSNVSAQGNFGVQAAGGGTNVVPIFYDGTVWRIG